MGNGAGKYGADMTEGLLGLGLLMGAQHALDADHLVAVSTLLSRDARLGRAARIGAMWGLGHTATLLLMGAGVLVLRLPLGEAVQGRLEALVGVMLVVLGGRVLWLAWRGEPHAHEHAHGDGKPHAHFHSHAPQSGSSHHGLPHPVVPERGLRAFLVGCVHGLAGSGALIVLVAASLPAASPAMALAAMAVFGAGTLVGMSLTSVALALPFAAAARWGRGQAALRAAAGIVSVALGTWIVLRQGGFA